MKNSLIDLNNHLFEQLERLGDEDVKGKKLEEEITRSEAITDVAKQVISNAALVLEAQVKKDKLLAVNAVLPKMLGGGS